KELQMVCNFRTPDMDVMGVAFRRELFLVTQQVYPELQDKEKLSHTKIQQKLLRKLGDDAFPFFEMRHINYNLPCSVKCAVEFEVKTTFEFLMSEKPLHVKLSLPKEMFYHGKLVRASVEITNSSSRNSKDISTSGDLICVVSASHDTKEYTLHPLLAHNREWRGLALDRQLKHEDTNLASSSMSETAHRKHTHTLFAVLINHRLLMNIEPGSFRLGTCSFCSSDRTSLYLHDKSDIQKCI
uniref:Arrestin C-terminal-like domain-containing protein n=1 Tax=Monopterus albus TaxID=43700 RepID=A0A3Q3R794_MONAL